MDKVICAIRFRELDVSIASDMDALLTHNKQKEEAKHYAISMALAAGGREIGEHESDLIFEIPLNQSEVIRDIHSRLENDLEISTTIGVGDDLKDAKKALDWAIENSPGTIKVMEPSIEDDKDEESQSFDHAEPGEVAIDIEGRPEQHVNKAEQDVDDIADDKETISDEMRSKIANIVLMLKSKKEYLSGLQQSNPELYAGVLALINSISSMAATAKMEDADKHSKMITKVARHLERAEEKHLDDHAASVLEMLIEAQQEHADKKDTEGRAMHEAAKRRYNARHRYARQHAKKTGADVKFLMNLNRAMRNG